MIGLNAAPRWLDKSDLERAIAKYEKTWWQTDAGVSAMCLGDADLERRLRKKALAEGRVLTSDVYVNPVSEAWTEDREALHEALGQGCLVRDSTAATRPVAYFTMGAPGVGKTNLLRRVALAHRTETYGDSNGLGIVDADRVRELLPEYGGGLGSEVVAIESYHIAYEIVYPTAMKQRRDLIYDTLGRDHAAKAMVALAAEGYQVQVLLGEAPADLCVERCNQRALRDGRIVGRSLIEEVPALARATLDDVLSRGIVAGWLRLETTDPHGVRVLDSGGLWVDTEEAYVRDLIATASL